MTDADGRHGEWTRRVVELAAGNVRRYRAEPFASIVVRGNRIVGQGTNLVGEKNDPTAHAEIEAIREACEVLNTTDLSDCVLYASGEPCPMCLGAIYWSGIKEVYFVYSTEDAAEAGLGLGGRIYEEMAKPREGRSIVIRQIPYDHPGKTPLELWRDARR